MKIAIIVSQFNKSISDKLLSGAILALKEKGLTENDWKIFEVPGAFEIPFMAAKFAGKKKFDGIIALGCVIKGETDHYKAICNGVTYGIQKVSIENRTPVMFGVLMCKSLKQALKRTSKGYECAQGLMKILNWV